MSLKGKLWTAAVALALTLLSCAFGYWVSGESMFMNGSLSMRHKGVGDDCSACHTPWRGVDDAKCAVCHKSTLRHKRDSKLGTVACTQCHREHGGQSASITYVNDTACASCHKSMTHKKKDPTAKGEFSRGGLLLTHSTLLEAKDFQHEKCLKCHKNLNFIKGMPTLTSMKGIMSGHLSNVENIKCADCHQPVSLVGFADAVGGGMDYAKCRKCHEKRRVSDSCVYCHHYHHVAQDYKPPV